MKEESIMAVSLRERPEINGKDADRLMRKIASNNSSHHLLVQRMVAEKLNEQKTRIRPK
jgi:hypothetical protein